MQMENLMKITLSCLSCFPFLLLQTDGAESRKVIEASGVSVLDRKLLVVGDESPGGYYKVQVPADPGMEVWHFPIDKGEWCEIPGGDFAADLESIDLIGDRPVVLSEQLRMLIGDTGRIKEYKSRWAEFAGRGLEGLAIRELNSKAWQLAVLWEGGYLERRKLPTDDVSDKFGGHSIKPMIFLHKIIESNGELEDPDSNWRCPITLDVEKPPGDEPNAQRFRAPDLVWHKLKNGRWGFIVLLSSLDSPKDGTPPNYACSLKRLQRFDDTGKPIPGYYDLKKNLPDRNWEGLAWFEEWKTLVLVYDDDDDAGAAVITLPADWQTDPSPPNP